MPLWPFTKIVNSNLQIQLAIRQHFHWHVAYDKVARCPYLFIIVLSALTSDLHSFVPEIFAYTPWTFSGSHPLTDVEYADDTVLIARTNEILSRLLHFLQHLATLGR